MTTPSGYRTQSRDTDVQAERLLFDHWREMRPVEKAELLTQLCASLRRLHLAGLAARYPDADEEELELREACERLGHDLVERVVGADRLPSEE